MKQPSCFREFARYASLNVLGMIGLSCYILADTYFISVGMGADGLAALNLAIPVYSFINGSGLMVGMGGGTKYSIRQNQGEPKEADRAFSSSVLLALGFAVVFVAAGLLLPDTLARLLGADGTVFEMTRTYLQVILLFSPMFLFNNLFLSFVRNDGAPQLAMAAMVVGSLSNVVLDYVFIFPFGLGIFGAALATGVAPVVSMTILSSYRLQKRNHFHLRLSRPRARLLAGICSAGVPSLITELSSGVVMIAFNAILLVICGSVGVAAYGVIANLSLVVIAIFTGISQGIQPLLSRHYGSGHRRELGAILRYALVTAVVIAAAVYAATFLWAGPVTTLFNSEGNAQLQQIAEVGLRLYFLGCPFAGVNIILSVYFASIEQPVPGQVIALLRGFAITLPMAFALAAAFGLDGVWCAFPVTEAIVTVVGAVLYRRARHLPPPLPETLP